MAAIAITRPRIPHNEGKSPQLAAWKPRFPVSVSHEMDRLLHEDRRMPHDGNPVQRKQAAMLHEGTCVPHNRNGAVYAHAPVQHNRRRMSHAKSPGPHTEERVLHAEKCEPRNDGPVPCKEDRFVQHAVYEPHEAGLVQHDGACVAYENVAARRSGIPQPRFSSAQSR